MDFKAILNQLNITAQCKKYGLSLWQCPRFIFMIMELVIISSALLLYAIGTKYIEDPLMVALVVLLSTLFLFILAFVITNSFDRLAEASRLKLEFLTIMSHQIKAPLTNLRWGIDLLISERADLSKEEQAGYLEVLKENSDRLKELINKIITVSKIEQGLLSLKKELFSLEDLVKKTILEFKAFATASNVKVKFEAQKDLAKILADPGQIREVIENFLDNAIKYTKEKGEVRINLSKKGKNIYFEIEDSGVGIPKEDQKYIFQKFFRSGNIARSQTRGSGLGLFIVKSIIEVHRGKVGFKSQEGKGSTFWFTLPIKS